MALYPEAEARAAKLDRVFERSADHVLNDVGEAAHLQQPACLRYQVNVLVPVLARNSTVDLARG